MCFSLADVKKKYIFFLFLIFELIKKQLNYEDSFQGKVLRGRQFQMHFWRFETVLKSLHHINVNNHSGFSNLLVRAQTNIKGRQATIGRDASKRVFQSWSNIHKAILPRKRERNFYQPLNKANWFLAVKSRVRSMKGMSGGEFFLLCFNLSRKVDKFFPLIIFSYSIICLC